MSPQPVTTMVPETAEPRAGSSGIPLWLGILSIVLIFLMLVYFDENSGWFKPEITAPFHNAVQVVEAQPPVIGIDYRLAQMKFEATCGICHQPDGMGKPGQFPPLAGSEWANGAPNRLIRIPLVGLVGPITVKGQPWNLSMPGLGSAVSDEDLALILSYVRHSWGNKGGEIKAEQVKAIRAELGSRSQQITEPELLKVTEK
jgi:mono/diheme cytochrome c family protein